MQIPDSTRLISAKDVLFNLTDLTRSTTLYIESLRGEKLEVEIESQAEMPVNGNHVINRVSKLFFRSIGRPCLYCISHINKEQLTNEEYGLINVQQLPLGKLFVQSAGEKTFRKKNILIVEAEYAMVAQILQLNSALLYKKKYELYVGPRRVGIIEEFFNE